jgi:hypothetical protein
MSDTDDLSCIIIKNENGDILYTMSSFTWLHFAYFRNIVRDSGDNKTIELVFMDDFGDFWKFLKNSNSIIDKIDFALNIKEYCNMLGLDDDGNIFCGKLDLLLMNAAIEFSNTLDICMNNPKSLNAILRTIHIRQELKKTCIVHFMCKHSSDPRCFSFIQDVIFKKPLSSDLELKS